MNRWVFISCWKKWLKEYVGCLTWRSRDPDWLNSHNWMIIWKKDWTILYSLKCKSRASRFQLMKTIHSLMYPENFPASWRQDLHIPGMPRRDLDSNSRQNKMAFYDASQLFDLKFISLLQLIFFCINWLVVVKYFWRLACCLWYIFKFLNKTTSTVFSYSVWEYLLIQYLIFLFF